MKMKHGLMVALMISTAAMAQDATNAPAPLPAPGPATPAPLPTPAPAPSPVDASVAAATNQPTAKKAKKSSKKKDTSKKALTARPIVEVPDFADNETAVAKQNNINIRGQAHINSEVVGHLKQGEPVTVMKMVTLKHPKTDEPAKWAQIAMPAGTHVWVNGTFLDTNQTVSASKLNVRSGPGENYSVVGTLKKGETVKALNVKGDWAEIDAPANSYAFVAAHLLARQTNAPEQVATATPVAPPVTNTVENPTPIAPANGTPTNTVATTETPTPTVTPNVPAPAPPPVDETPAKRIVQREGIVGGTVSIQAPTHYELESLDDGRPMDYLYTTSTNLKLDNYKGLTVLVAGEEALDERWPNTPVITIQKIQVVK